MHFIVCIALCTLHHVKLHVYHNCAIFESCYLSVKMLVCEVKIKLKLC